MIWDKENQSLRTVADSASRNKSWVDYAAYCADRERGLRRHAFQHLQRFVASARRWTFKERKYFVNWLCQQLVKGGTGRLIPTPLINQLVTPTLEDWVKAEPMDATPRRWLGLYFAEGPDDKYSHLMAALARDPSDQLARICITGGLIENSEDSCNYLPHEFVGDPADDARRLRKARRHLVHIDDPEDRKRLQSELDYVSQLIEDWVTFTHSGESDFKQWCADRGRTYHWPKESWIGEKTGG